MECNREEAVRARALAEAKMASQDYLSAKKYALKAQQLFPGLENMVQIMAVIDVHMAALVKVAGCNELDWYGILQVEPSADEAAVKKQYRKLALCLHPDKNKFAGAEAAFKLIGEASQVLSDKMKRLAYNAKRGLAQTRATPLTPRHQRANNRQHQQQQNVPNVVPSQPPAQHLTFWTACPFCHMRYQYMRKFEDKNLLCLHCRKAFIAKDLERVNPTQVPSSRTRQPTNPTAGPNGFASGGHNVTHTNNTGKAAPAPKAGPFPAAHVESRAKAAQREEVKKELHRRAQDFFKTVEQKRAKQNGAKVPQKEDTQKDFCGKSQEPLRSVGSQEEQVKHNATQVAQKDGEKELHRKAHEFLKNMELEKERAKQRKEQMGHTNVTDCTADLSNGSKVSEKEQQERSEELQGTQDFQRNEEQTNVTDCAAELSNGSKVSEKEQQDRSEELQRAQDFRRNEELRRSTELQTELETVKEQLRNTSAPDQSKAMDDKAEVDKKEHTDVPLKVSKKQGKKYYDSSSSETEEDEENWKSVAANWKTEGLPRRSSRNKRNVAYDCDDSDDDFQHVPPSKKAKIDEVGSPGQDTKNLATPQKLAHLAKQAIRVNLNLGKTTAFADKDEAQVVTPGRRGPEHLEKEMESPVSKDAVSGSSYTIPDAEFFNFDQGREEKDVQVGQVWALYDDMDGMPRYYMKVKDVRSYNPFQVSVGWFEVRKPSEEQCELLDMGYSLTCGEFRMSSSQVMHNVNSFSHLVKWEKVGKGIIKVHPKTGEIWCLYEDWEEGQQLLKAGDTPLKYCMVEVLSDYSEVCGVTVMLLKKVEGSKTVYQSANAQFLKIPSIEILRFSHQVPAYKVTASIAPNVPKKCWELDPSAIPSILLKPDAAA